jgi:hypothetical protein
MSGGALLNPASFAQGGLIDDVDVTVKASRFELYDYDGKSQQPTLALHWTLVDSDGLESEQYWSAGDPKFFVPSKDGKEAIPVGSRTALAGGSNFAILISSLVNAGYPADDLGSDISVFEGMQVHVARVPQPKRSGIINRGGENEREKTVLTVSKIINMPGEAPVKKAGAAAAKATPAAAKAGTPAAAKPAAAAKSAPAPAADTGDLDATLTDVTMEALAEAGGSMTKKDLATIAFRAPAFTDAKSKAAAPKRAYADEFLTTGPWSYDPATGTLSLE